MVVGYYVDPECLKALVEVYHSLLQCIFSTAYAERTVSTGGRYSQSSLLHGQRGEKTLCFRVAAIPKDYLSKISNTENIRATGIHQSIYASSKLLKNSACMSNQKIRPFHGHVDKSANAPATFHPLRVII